MIITIDIKPGELQEVFERLVDDQATKAAETMRATIAECVTAAIALEIKNHLPTEERFRETVEAMVTIARSAAPAKRRRK